MEEMKATFEKSQKKTAAEKLKGEDPLSQSDPWKPSVPVREEKPTYFGETQSGPAAGVFTGTEPPVQQVQGPGVAGSGPPVS